MFNNLKTNLLRTAGRSSIVVKKFSPEILLGFGVVGILTSTVLACKATLKVEDVQNEHQDKVDKVSKCWQDVQSGALSLDEYSEKDHKKDLTVIYVQTAVNFTKLYGLAVAIGATSIACIVYSHNIMKTRNVALVAAYKTVEEGFAAYRKRVIEDYGEEQDYMYKNGIRAEQIIDPAYTDDDGVKHKAEKRTVTTMTGEPSMYARIFDESCQQWSKDANFNLMFVRATQNYYNNILQARGHVFLNEVYEALGFQHTKAGAAVGWVLGEGDSCIDFGIFNHDGSQKKQDFINGNERSVLLDFNVDGLIWDRI